MAIGGVVLQFRADADKARKDVNKLTKSIRDVGDESKTSGARMSKMGKVGIAAVAAGAALGAAALYDFAKAAAKDWQEAKKLERTLKKIPGVTDDMVASNAKWIDSMEILTGMADSDFRDAIARLSVATGDLGKAQDIASLAADVAAGRNKNLLDIVPLLEKAYGGNTQALKRQMPWLDANKDGTLTFKEAVDGLTEAYGGAAKAAADNDPWKRISAIWGQLKESLGQFIIPSLEALAAWFSDEKNLAGLQTWITKVGDLSRELGTKLVDYIKSTVIPFWNDELVPAIQNVYAWFNSAEGRQAIKDWGDAIKTAGDAIGTLVGWLDKLSAAWDKIPDLFKSSIGAFVGKDGRFNPLNPKNMPGYVEPTPVPPITNPLGGRLGPNSLGSKLGPGGSSTVNVTVINGKQEPSVDSAALALRLTRNLKGVA